MLRLAENLFFKVQSRCYTRSHAIEDEVSSLHEITAEILNKVMRVLHSLVQMLMHTFNCMVVNSIQTMAIHVENCHKYHIIQNPFQDDISTAKNQL